MYITKERLKTIDLRNGKSPRTNPTADPVSQALKKDKQLVSLRCTKVVQRSDEKLRFSPKNF